MASFHICKACRSAYKVFFDGARDAHVVPQKWVLARALEGGVEGVTRTRVIDDPLTPGVELHVKGSERIIPRVVSAAERGGFELVDLSVAEPSLETVFINLTGKDLRE